MSVTLSEPISDLVAVVDKVRADDRLVTSSDQKLNELETIFDAITTLQASAVRRLREVWNSDAAEESCGRTTKGWLREEQHLAGVDASRYLRLAHNLRCFPLVEAAFEAAAISLPHVVAIVTAMQSVPKHLWETIEPHLVERARFYPPEEIAGYIDELLQLLGHDRLSDIRRERRYAQRGVNVHQTLHGTRSLSGTLTPDVGQTFERALELASQPTGPDDDRTPSQRAHDALGVVAGAYVNGHDKPSFDGAPRTVIITMDLETLENQLRDKWFSLPDGAQISADTARRLACDAEVIPVVLGGKGEVLDIGKADREFTVPIRRAAYVRDGGRCAFPDCRGKVVELHHLVFRRHGGPTSLDNAAWLCAFHHWLVHEGGWTLERDPVDKSYLWTGPGGRQRRRRIGTA